MLTVIYEGDWNYSSQANWMGLVMHFNTSRGAIIKRMRILKLFSIKWLGDQANQVTLSGETTTAFGVGISDFDVDGT